MTPLDSTIDAIVSRELIRLSTPPGVRTEQGQRWLREVVERSVQAGQRAGTTRTGGER